MGQEAFLGGSHGKESACNVGDPVQSLGGEDPLEKELIIHCKFLPGKSHEQRSLVGYSTWTCKRVGQD